MADEKKLGPVKQTDITKTVLVGVSDEGFHCTFRISKSDWENNDSFTCKVNMKTYKKEDLKLVQTYDKGGDE